MPGSSTARPEHYMFEVLQLRRLHAMGQLASVQLSDVKPRYICVLSVQPNMFLSGDIVQNLLHAAMLQQSKLGIVPPGHAAGGPAAVSSYCGVPSSRPVRLVLQQAKVTMLVPVLDHRPRCF